MKLIRIALIVGLLQSLTAPAAPPFAGGDGERVFVQPDREVYAVSDAVRFAAFVSGGTGAVPSADRLTVCLLDPTGRVVSETSCPAVSGRADGSLSLPDSLGEGEYRLVAWTAGMEAGSPQDVFVRSLYIRERAFPKLFITLTPDARWYNAGDMAGLGVHMTYPDGKPFAGAQFVYLATRNGIPYQNGLEKTDENGDAGLTIRIPALEAGGMIVVRIDTELGDLKGSSAILLPAAGLPLEVAFFPEGGALTDGRESRVGFRIRDFEGQPFEMEGLLVDSHNRVTDTVRTSGPGYGSFRIRADRSNPLRIRITKPTGMNLEYPLPPVRAEGPGLTVVSREGGRFVFGLAAAKGGASAGLTAVAECGNREIARVPVDPGTGGTFTVDAGSGDTGVIRVRLLDAAGATVANRPVIVRLPDARLKATAEPGKGYLNGVGLALEDPQGRATGASLCVSLTDGVISPDWTREPGIREWLWLGPASRGLPPGYLSDPSILTDRQLDDLALSLTDTAAGIDPGGDFRTRVMQLQRPGPMGLLIPEIRRERFFSEFYLPAGSDLPGFIRKNKSLLQQTGFIPGKPSQDDRIRQQLEIGVPILSVIRSIEPFTLTNNQIYFSKGQNSLQYPKGALIVVDGAPKGNDVSILDYFSPHDISSIRISEKVSDILKYSADASAVILITTRNSSGAQEEEKKNGPEYDPTLFWKPGLTIGTTGTAHLGFPKPAMKTTWTLVIRGIDDRGQPVEAVIRYPGIRR